MTTDDAYAATTDPKTLVLGRLVSTLAEDAMFGLATGGGPDVLEGLGKRRGEAYSAVLAGHRLNTMATEFDNWVVELTRAVAPIYPPAWLPMAEVIREKVTLEVGARGLRSLFSSKPSDKDVQRVKRLGTLAVRILRAVFVADGTLDPEETRTIAGVIASLGLPDADGQALYLEAPIAVEQLDVYGDIDATIGKAILRGAWLAAAWDQIDPREEHVVRVLGNKLSVPAMDLEILRNEAVQQIDARRVTGMATIDGIRFVLSDRMPGHGVTLAAKAGSLMLPRRFREEGMAQVGAGTKVVLAKRYPQVSSDDKNTVLGMVWAAAMYEDPSLARRALLRSRHDRVAIDLGEDGNKSRHDVESWLVDVLAPAAFPMGADFLMEPEMKTKTLGFIGGGNMAAALVKGLLHAKVVPPSSIIVSDVKPERLTELGEAHGIKTTQDNHALIRESDVVVLSVKPQVIDKVLAQIGNDIKPGQLVISVAAGVPVSAIEARLPEGTHVVRSMPNTPATVQAGATAIAPGTHATEEDLAVARELFTAVGRVVTLDETLLDAVTGLSGSGPAYVMVMIEAMADGGVKVGLHRDTALLLAAQTVYGSAKLLLDTGEHPGRLKDMVTSPGGTAIAGLHTLESGGLRRTLIDAVEAATNRAIQLGEIMAAKMTKK